MLVKGLPGHPLHPPLTDVTIGAYGFATVAAVLSKLGVADHGFAMAWWLALVVGLVSSILTIGSGLVEWLSIDWGSPLWRSATIHALVNAGASVLFLIAAIAGHGGYVSASVTTGAFVLTLVGFGTLIVGGWLGGALTYVYGMRVLSLPDEPAARASSPLPHEELVNAEK
jgi:uncharacterized membrane protein